MAQATAAAAKDRSQERQKAMIASHYRRLARCPETGEKVPPPQSLAPVRVSTVTVSV